MDVLSHAPDEIGCLLFSLLLPGFRPPIVRTKTQEVMQLRSKSS